MIGFAGQSEGSVYNATLTGHVKLSHSKLKKKRKNHQAQMLSSEGHVNSVVAKGENLQRSFENEHWTEAGPKSDRNNKQSETRDTGLHHVHSKISSKKQTFYSDITTCTRKIFLCLETALAPASLKNFNGHFVHSLF